MSYGVRDLIVGRCSGHCDTVQQLAPLRSVLNPDAMLHLYTECALSARSVRGSVSGRAGARALARRASTAHSRRPARVLAMAGGRESERKQVDAPVSVPVRVSLRWL